jgi:hypothetical protein
MPSITQEIEVGSGAAEAWAVVSDTSRWNEWLTIHSGWPQGEPTLADGADFVQSIMIMGIPAVVSWSVVELADGSRLHMRGSGPMGAQLETIWSVAATAGGAQVSYQADFSGGAIDGPMGAPVVAQAGTEAARSLGNLKGLIEG